MTSPIPRSARPVVWFIRWWVKKPRTLPTNEVGALLWWKGNRYCCPLGLLPMATVGRPYSDKYIGSGFRKREIKAFWKWWDSQTDARAAVDAVWPE